MIHVIKIRITCICLFLLRFNVPVNNFSVISVQSLSFLGNTSTSGSKSVLLKDTTRWRKVCNQDI